ncbi:MAG: family 2 glycosyl transferase [Lentisphaerae bacterium GWF2_57_35]|nr:MAG: family 2 glycosyl transferase [Lentisphaerae bacterium GWF2_57_35]
MTATTPIISIIIRCRNEERHIGRLLEGILSQQRKDAEIIVVDSGSTDATLLIARRYPVKIISVEPASFSFGYALNRGCEEAQGEFLVFVSAHVYPVYRNWLDEMLQPFADEKVALVYGRQCGDIRTKYAERRIFAKWFPSESSACQAHAFCNNANTAVRKCVWMTHRYDESLTGLEDLDWARRVKALGYRIAYQAQAEVVHVHEETYRQIYTRYYREAIAMKRMFPEEQFSFFDLIRALTGNVISDWRYALHEHVLHREWIRIVRFRTMQFVGTFKGYRMRIGMLPELRDRFYYPDGRPPATASVEAATNNLIIDYSRQDGGHDDN